MKLPDLYKCNIAILGLGYVGLPLAVEFASIKECMRTGKKINRKIIGFDLNEKRLSQLKNGIDITKEVNIEEFNLLENIQFTNDNSLLEEVDIYIVTVPTPIDKNNNPDFTFLINATTIIGESIKKKNSLFLNENNKEYTNPIIIYESTVYPGATEEICAEILEKVSGLIYNNEDTRNGFFCGYSPERINPGDNLHKLSNVVKVTSGSNPIVADWIDALYGSIIKAGTFKVKNIKIAEAAKVIENIQRDINISLMNELSMIFKKLDIDTLDVIEAASTKWNFMQYKPGLVGGHCIGVDPYYLAYKAEEVGHQPQLLTAGRKINDEMGNWIVTNFIKSLLKSGITIDKPKILILGLTFKENCPDIRNTKVINIIRALEDYGIKYDIIDPWVEIKEARKIYSLEIKNQINFKNKYQGIICAVAHKEFIEISAKKFKSLVVENGIIYDIKGCLKREINAERI